MLRTCEKRFGNNIDDVSRIGDKIQCYVVTYQGKKQHGFDVTLDGQFFFNGKDKGNAGLGFNTRVFEDNGTKVTVERRSIGVIDVCEYKHPGIGAWPSKGGASCDDSYQERIK